MSHPSSHPEDEDEITMKPRPRGRNFELVSEPASSPPTPSPPADTMSSSQSLQAPGNIADGSSTPARTRSILNLTSSTLFGIYQPTGYATDREEPSTPWGTGAETPVDSPNGSFDFTRSRIPDTIQQKGSNGHIQRRRSTITPAKLHHRPRKGFKGYFLPLATRLVTLFGIGVLYGVLISHLHDKQDIVPVKVSGFNRQGWPYLLSWGLAGVLLGEGLPHLDKLWAPEDDDVLEESEEPRRTGPGSGDWLDVVRAIGAFVGVAFAIRKTPWHSTLQLSLTLALANPALWYLLDRSPAGFIMSSIVALGGMGVLLGINPTLVLPPSQVQVPQGRGVAYAGNGTLANGSSEALVLGVFSQESVGVATWIASVLFVSAVCFGNIGRRLVPRST